MYAFIIDLTHGGVKISIELAKLKKYKAIYSYDLYNTLKDEDKNLLEVYDIKLIKDLDELKSKIQESNNYKEPPNSKNIIINPIHSSLNLNELLSETERNSFEISTHHEGVKLILENWKLECKKQDVKCIELTGVKGKTSTAYILKEIFQMAEKNMLLLSSLGSHLFKELGTTKKFRDLILEKNISITPASILKTVELAKKVGNPKCSYQKSNCKSINELEIEDLNLQKHRNNPYSNLNYKIALFESSLGVTGLGDIAILTNIVENYPIAKGSSNAQEAKKQIFNCPLVVAEEETLDKFYKKEREFYKDKINTFSTNTEIELDTKDKNSKSPNLIVKSIDYQMDKTKINIQYKNLKTINNELISGDLEVISFALGEHHIKNIITAITTALSLNIDETTIKEGLLNFKGIPGRSSIRLKENSRIIEEINPGINTKAIESSIKMLENIKDYYIIIGGKYGVTCEEIDEDKLSKFLEDYLDSHNEVNLILTDELGKSLKNKLNKDIKFIEDYEDAQEIAISENKDILFIYRSNYSQISKR